MNKVTHINIGGIPFIMDEDAYKFLDFYFESISRHFNESEGSEEIIEDIESRIAELLNEKKGARQVVQMEDVKYAINVMGRPEEFGASPMEETTTDHSGRKKSDTGFNPGKRLYKNPDDKVVSGVCSGLSMYFGIKDPIWIRLLFVLLASVGGGSGIPIYFVLMVLLKDAKTSKEKLEMKGDPINLENLKKTMEAEFKNLGETFKDFGKKNADGSGSKIAELGNTLSEGFSVIGQNLEAFFRQVARVLRPIIYLLGGLLILGLVILWSTILFSAIGGSGTFKMFLPASSWTGTLAVFCILLLVLLPLLSIGLSVIHTFFSVRIKPVWYAAIWGLWTLNFVGMVFVVKNVAENLKVMSSVDQKVELNPVESGTYSIEASHLNADNIDYMFDIGGVSVAKNAITLEFVEVEIARSATSNVEIHIQRMSHGSSKADAEQYAEEIAYQTVQEGNKILLPDFQQLTEGQKFHNQRINVRILVPDGKQIQFGKKLGNLVFDSYVGGDAVSTNKLKGKTLTMTEKGVVITDTAAKDVPAQK